MNNSFLTGVINNPITLEQNLGAEDVHAAIGSRAANRLLSDFQLRKS